MHAGNCFYCSRKVYRYPDDPGKARPKDDYTRDHIIPRSKRGQFGLSNSYTEKNIVIACAGCNEAKGDMNPYHVFEYLSLGTAQKYRQKLLDLGLHPENVRRAYEARVKQERKTVPLTKPDHFTH